MLNNFFPAEEVWIGLTRTTGIVHVMVKFRGKEERETICIGISDFPWNLMTRVTGDA